MENNFIETIIKKEESPKTYLEILKVHNKEVPMANLLAFFFRPNEKHGLKNLFINALLSTRHYSLNSLKSDELRIQDDVEISNVKVRTEVNAGNDKRIDILIDTANFVICIEFKINHDLDNPITTYQKYIEKKFKNKKHFFLILTPTKKEPVKYAKAYFDENNSTSKNIFKQVILSHFIERIKDLYSKEYINNFIFNDFIQTIENRSLKTKQEKKLTDTIQNAGLSIYTAPFIPTHKSEFWSELLTKVKVKLLSKELSLFDDLKPSMISYHKNYKSGFIQITQNKYNLKIRIENSKWQIEKWSKENTRTKNTIKIIDYNSDFNVIKSEIINYIT